MPSQHWRWRPQTIIAILVIIAGLTIAKAVFLPLTVAVLGGFLFRPIVRWLEKWHIPAGFSALGIIALLFTIIAVAGFHLVEPFQEWMDKLPRAARNIQYKVQELSLTMSSVGEIGQAVEDITKNGSSEVTRVKIDDPGWARWIMSSVQDIVALWIVLILALYFMLTHGDRVVRNIMTMIPGLTNNGGGSQGLIMGGDGNEMSSSRLMRDLEDMVSTYLVTITLLNLLLGTLVTLAMYLIGMDAPLLWGAMAFLFNFLPYLGSFIGIIIISLGSFIFFEDPSMAIWPPIVYATLTTLEGNLLSPLVLGWRMAMNPFVIFVWLLLLGWMWGVLGALIAVPLLMVIKIVCSHSKSQRWLASIIAS